MKLNQIAPPIEVLNRHMPVLTLTLDAANGRLYDIKSVDYWLVQLDAFSVTGMAYVTFNTGETLTVELGGSNDEPVEIGFWNYVSVNTP